MADPTDDLLDYEDDEQQAVAETPAAPKKDVKGTYVSIHSSGFRDFLLKPEILRAIVDCGFEHPSEGKSTSFSNYSCNFLNDDNLIGTSELTMLTLESATPDNFFSNY